MEEEPVEDPTPQDLEAQLEERRRKRREILERFAGIESGAGSVASSAGGSVTGGKPCVIGNSSFLSWLPWLHSVTSGLGSSTAKLNLESTTPSLQTTPLPVNSEFDVAKHSDRLSGQTDSGDVLPVETRAKEVDGEEQISAADYNPDEDRKVDDERKQALFKDKEVVDVDKKEEDSEWEEFEVDAEEDDDFDMFALEEAPKKKVIRRKKQVSRNCLCNLRVLLMCWCSISLQKHDKPVTSAVSATINSMDNYDDAEGYYRITPGEILNAGRYKVTINLGKGMFAQVIRATVLLDNDEDGEKKGSEVAIKVIRSQESMWVCEGIEMGVVKTVADLMYLLSGM
jgi:serine/threonine-protein kinase PRP4